MNSTRASRDSNRLPAAVFIALALLTGVLYGVVTPPLQAPDEWNHLYRAWAISEWQLKPTRQGDGIGYLLPEELPALARELAEPIVSGERWRVEPERIRAALDSPPAGERRVFVNTPNTVYLTGIAYFPQAAGIAAGKLLRVSPVECLYLARLGNLLAGTLLVALALRAEPRRPWLLALVALAPMASFLRASASPDVVIMGVAFWLTARIGSLALVPGAVVTRRDWIVILAGSAVLSPMKIIYAPIAMAAWLIPDCAFASRAAAWRARLLQAMVIAIPALIASAHASRLWAPYRFDTRVNPEEQLAVVLSDPIRAGALVAGDLFEFWPRYLAQIVGQLGWLSVSLPKTLLVGYLLVLAFVWWLEARTVLERRRWLVAGFLVASVVAAASLSQYLIWTGVGEQSIEGMQGRYVLPLVPLAAWLMPIHGPKIAPSQRAFAILTILVVLAATTVSLHCIVMRYYPEGWASLL